MSLDEVAELRARVTDLQAHNTKIENERRRYKNLYTHAHALLVEVLVDSTIAMRMAGPARFHAEAHEAELKYLNAMRKVQERIDLLEGDTWCNAATVAREFMVDIAQVLARHDTEGTDAIRALERWSDRFAEALAR